MPTAITRKLYDFKTLPELQWTIIVGAIGALAGSVANFFGATPEVMGTTSVTAASVARGLGGLLRDDYDLKSWWEVAWAGVQAGSGVIAAAIAHSTSADALQTTVIATTASASGRQVLAAVLASLERVFSGGLINDPPPAGGVQP